MKALGTLLLLGSGLWARQSILGRHRERIRAGDLALFKGSNSMRRGELIEALGE